MESFSFNGLVASYDETRSFDKGCFDSALQYISNAFPVSAFPVLFEPGIGNGRIAVPLAQMGYRVVGADISDEMLNALKRRLEENSETLPVLFPRADITRLPFPDEVFDAAVAVHIFYFVRDWKRAVREILRVVRNGGAVILMHTGTGSEIPFVNRRYKEICASLGSPVPELGVKSNREAADYFQSLGCEAEWIQDRWRWISRIPVGKALEYIRNRAYSFTVFPSDSIHAVAVEILESELKGKFDAPVEVPNQVYLVILRKPESGR